MPSAPLPPPRLVLASTSPFRRELLARLGLPFEVTSPDIDESPLVDEVPATTACRLAEAKARATANRMADALIIGSDQIACAHGDRYGKPGNRENAIAQLLEMSGRCIVFHTAVVLLHAPSGRVHTECVPTEVKFRDLVRDEIERYVDIDRPFNCAGSAKSEALGIALLEHMRGDDPTALVGLPLIALCRMLRQEGVRLP